MSKWSTLNLSPIDVSIRWKRLLRHLIYPIYRHPSHLKVQSFWIWLLDIWFYISDILFFPELYKAAYFIFKPNIRLLSNEEVKLGQSVFKDCIDFGNVYIDNFSGRVSKKYGIAYVSFNLIHSWQSLRKDVFIHELMHVYQYYQYGSVYIVRALWAQKSKEGYDYGGIEGLAQAINEGKGLFDFNFEQQASIIEHYFDLRERLGEAELLEKGSPYLHFWHQLLGSKRRSHQINKNHLIIYLSFILFQIYL
ncbi:MAG: hypothetical protein KA340_00090 [Saprospiraceae bacterium]|jgi:hypothetical protein|nr:hypothetical protein [Saprospiraceae bacterium]